MTLLNGLHSVISQKMILFNKKVGQYLGLDGWVLASDNICLDWVPTEFVWDSWQVQLYWSRSSCKFLSLPQLIMISTLDPCSLNTVP
jgi:hypothetical protein